MKKTSRRIRTRIFEVFALLVGVVAIATWSSWNGEQVAEPEALETTSLVSASEVPLTPEDPGYQDHDHVDRSRGLAASPTPSPYNGISSNRMGTR